MFVIHSNANFFGLGLLGKKLGKNEKKKFNQKDFVL
jgi:hypothetical protein